MAERRFRAAADAFEEMAGLKSNSPYAFAMALNCLSQDGGDVEALAFYHRRREAIETSIAAPAEGEAPLVSLLQANIAWVAVKAASEERALADTYSLAALETDPESAAALTAELSHSWPKGVVALKQPNCCFRAIRWKG